MGIVFISGMNATDQGEIATRLQYLSCSSMYRYKPRRFWPTEKHTFPRFREQRSLNRFLLLSLIEADVDERGKDCPKDIYGDF